MLRDILYPPEETKQRRSVKANQINYVELVGIRRCQRRITEILAELHGRKRGTDVFTSLGF